MSFSASASTPGRARPKASPVLPPSCQRSRDVGKKQNTRFCAPGVEESRCRRSNEVSTSPHRKGTAGAADAAHVAGFPQTIRRSPWSTAGPTKAVSPDRSGSPARSISGPRTSAGPLARSGRTAFSASLGAGRRSRSWNDAPVQSRTPSPCMTRSAGSQQHVATSNVPIEKCWQALELIVPLRNSLCAVLEQPRGAWSGMGIPGPPPRVGSCRSPPTTRDLIKLRDACSAMHFVLGSLKMQPDKESDEQYLERSESANKLRRVPSLELSESGTKLPRVPSLEGCASKLPRVPSLEQCAPVAEELPRRCEADPSEEIMHLRVRADELEESNTRCTDLEKVAAQLRARVAELEERRAMTGDIRAECANLRVRIAELVGAGVHVNMLEQDRLDLQAHLHKLESGNNGAMRDRAQAHGATPMVLAPHYGSNVPAFPGRGKGTPGTPVMGN